jgi:GNAT superfamily N-acetyltransferase
MPTITTTYLELTTATALIAAPESNLTIQEATIPCPELNRFLYTAVGGSWYWLDRLAWSYEKWQQHLSQPQVRTWVAYVGGNPAGYFELLQDTPNSVEISYFGLLPQFLGKGHGGYLLTTAIRQAWDWGAHRVWVHTCTLDGPYALKNYLARGFSVYDEQTHEVDALPAKPIGPWPGAF